MESKDSCDIVIIGAGNVATHISRHLFASGHRISFIFSREEGSAERLAGQVGAKATTRLEEIPAGADFFIFAVPDREVSQLAQKMKDRSGIFLHTAGALPMDVFRGVVDDYGVFYPLQTLSRDRPVKPEDIPILYEASSPEISGRIRMLAQSTYPRVEERDSPSRLHLHLAGVFANNFSNYMLHISREILREHSLETDLLDPLLEETYRKALDIGPGAAQTGPALRSDKATMQKHIDLLKTHPEWENLYTFISREIERSRDKEK